MANIARRPDGRWRARYRGDDGREHSRHFDRKVDAQRWLDQVTTSIVSGQYVDPKAGRVTLGAYYSDWSHRQLWETNTRMCMDLAVKSSGFADLPLSSLRRSHVETMVKEMTGNGLAPGTCRTRFNNVKTILRAARRDRLIAIDPSEGVTLPRAQRREAAMRLPTAETVAEVLQASEPHFKTFIAIAAFSGLRLGEIAALQVGDIDFLRRAMAVTRQVQRGSGGVVELRAPKYGSERTVFLAPTLVDMIAHHVGSFCPNSDATTWLFAPTGSLQPPHQNTVGHLWRKACRKAAVSGTTLHDLRHFYASGLIAAGCDVVTVQRALGHAKATTTLNTYSHLWPTAEDRTRASADVLMQSTLGVLADYVRTNEAP